jgi:hypothetical protein
MASAGCSQSQKIAMMYGFCFIYITDFLDNLIFNQIIIIYIIELYFLNIDQHNIYSIFSSGHYLNRNRHVVFLIYMF